MDSEDDRDYRSLFGASSDCEHDHDTRSPSPQDYPMGDPIDEPRVNQDSFDESDVVSLTLDGFVRQARDLADEDMAKFSRFVLTGILDNVQHQVDPIKDALTDDHRVQALRDFDSVLGIHKDVCIDTSLAVYPVSKFSDTLSRNVHIKYSFSNRRGEHLNVPVHTIPNLCIGKWGTHNLLRVLIPALYDPTRKSPFLKQEHLSTFYTKGLRPAVNKLVPIAANEWPPTYSAEMTRARGKDGKLAFQTKRLAQWHMVNLGDSIRQSLSANNVPWAEGLVFLHQIRGVKSSSGHTPARDAANTSLDEFLQEHHMTDSCRTEGEWWVDVGLEIASDDQNLKCLAWRTDSHFHIVRHVLRIHDGHAGRITSLGSSKYMRDLTSHLTAVSGCRISPGVRAQGPHKAAYMQMYTTDKALTYRQEGSHFGKFLTGQDILRNKADDFCRGLYDIYREAALTNHGLARVEVRVPLSQAAIVMTDIDIPTIRSSLVAVDPVVWWSLRAYRVRAFQYILEQQALGDPVHRAMNSAILLTAAAPWFVNGLHSTPDNGPASRDLMGKILPLVERMNANADTLLYPTSTRLRAAVARHHAQSEEDDEAPEGDESTGEEPVIADHQPEDNLSVASDLSDTGRAALEHPHGRQGDHQEMLPHVPYGIVFLRPFRIGNGVPTPRFQDRTVQMVTLKTFKYIFGIHRENVDGTFFKSKLVLSAHPTRVANRVRTVVHAPRHPAPPIFNLSEHGYTLQAPVADTGSDLSDMDDEMQDRRGNEDNSIDGQLTSMWNQFLLDITSKAPNRKRSQDTTYCVLSAEERLSVTEATYQNMRLRDYFDDCQYRIATTLMWDDAFDKYWPFTPFLVQGSQNFASMTYFTTWAMLVNRLKQTDDENTLNEMRKALRDRFNTLGWVPHPDGQRVWYTKRQEKQYKKLPRTDPRAPAPRVLIRMDLEPILN